jgi:hypothetical protein
MTESEWLSTATVDCMVEEVLPRASKRKMRLFAVACCRRIWDRLSDEPSRRAVETSERYADGLASRKELMASRKAMLAGKSFNSISRPDLFAASSASRPQIVPKWIAWLVRNAGDPNQEAMAQRELLHDIFGNPFRPVPVEPVLLGWNEGIIPRLARGIYDERAFDRLPILADALEEAGAAEPLVAHCRQEGVHVPGCWLLDALLERA